MERTDDAFGLGFHLPAYLSAVVKHGELGEAGDMVESLLFQLTHLDEYYLGRFSILNHAQRRCVRTVLRYLWAEAEDAELYGAIQGSQNAEGPT